MTAARFLAAGQAREFDRHATVGWLMATVEHAMAKDDKALGAASVVIKDIVNGYAKRNALSETLTNTMREAFLAMLFQNAREYRASSGGGTT